MTDWRTRRLEHTMRIRRLGSAVQEKDPVHAPIPSFIVTVEGSAVHVVCGTLEQALEQAELLSQQQQRRVLVQEEGAAKAIATVEPPL